MEQIHTTGAPQAIGPYSQAIKLEGLVFASGQIAFDPTTMEVTGDIRAQTLQALTNLRAVLEAAGTGIDRVVKTTVYMTDLGDFAAMNEVYAEVFGNSRPARTTVGVAALPRQSRIEIDAIAVERPEDAGLLAGQEHLLSIRQRVQNW